MYCRCNLFNFPKQSLISQPHSYLVQSAKDRIPRVVRNLNMQNKLHTFNFKIKTKSRKLICKIIYISSIMYLTDPLGLTECGSMFMCFCFKNTVTGVSDRNRFSKSVRLKDLKNQFHDMHYTTTEFLIILKVMS